MERRCSQYKKKRKKYRKFIILIIIKWNISFVCGGMQHANMQQKCTWLHISHASMNEAHTLDLVSFSFSHFKLIGMHSPLSLQFCLFVSLIIYRCIFDFYHNWWDWHFFFCICVCTTIKFVIWYRFLWLKKYLISLPPWIEEKKKTQIPLQTILFRSICRLFFCFSNKKKTFFSLSNWTEWKLSWFSARLIVKMPPDVNMRPDNKG